MIAIWKSSFGRGLIALSLLLLFSTVGEAGEWKDLDRGLLLAEFVSPRESPGVDCPVVVLKVDPSVYSFRLLSASEHGGKARTARQWCEEFGLLAAINASMYRREDPRMSTGFMRNYGHTNNPKINPQFGAFMVFNPKDAGGPRVRIVDSRREKDWQGILDGYNTVVQNYRMISHGEKAGWPQQNRVYSTAAIGVDKDGNVLFIQGRAPRSTHDFIHLLLSLPLNIRHAMYVEGGLETTLCVTAGPVVQEWVGSHGPCSAERDGNGSVWPLPNVIGVVK